MGANLPNQSDTEAPELGAMLARMIRSLVRRATAGELDALGELSRLHEAARAGIAEAARGAHDGPGHYSWTEVGNELGISRQAARQLYGRQGDPADD